MEIALKNGNIRIEPSDWRWSASIVGLHKYFEYYDIELKTDEDGIEFDLQEITEERYLKFAENFFSDSMHHIYVEEMIKKESLTNLEVKELNKKLTANVVMKNNFSDLKLTNEESLESLKEEIQQKIDENRIEIIKATYKGGKSLYANFCEDKIFQEKGKCCRLKGYYIDMARKSKSISFMRDKKSIVTSDSKFMDFIPFAFSKTRESFFINNNSEVIKLINSNRVPPDSDSKSLRSQIFDKSQNASTFIDYDVEIIIKDREKDYYETLFIREEGIKIFEKLEKFSS
ncbi:MAG: type I CRISPR-associated protein Cas8a1/Csx8, partial [Cetobacterium sp.]